MNTKIMLNFMKLIREVVVNEAIGTKDSVMDYTINLIFMNWITNLFIGQMMIGLQSNF